MKPCKNHCGNSACDHGKCIEHEANGSEKVNRYRVSGIAMVPVEVVIDIETVGRHLSAIAAAQEMFKRNPSNWIVGNSSDEREAHDWRPTAEQLNREED